MALREVFAPVTASVLTTLAAFLPLMLLPGIVGKFMIVIPFVVTLALSISLLEAYWMMPAHMIHVFEPRVGDGHRTPGVIGSITGCVSNIRAACCGSCVARSVP